MPRKCVIPATLTLCVFLCVFPLSVVAPPPRYSTTLPLGSLSVLRPLRPTATTSLSLSLLVACLLLFSHSLHPRIDCCSFHAQRNTAHHYHACLSSSSVLLCFIAVITHPDRDPQRRFASLLSHCPCWFDTRYSLSSLLFSCWHTT
jgi:hypothetical protein